jgi:small-conductance mechanosensitive channel
MDGRTREKTATKNTNIKSIPIMKKSVGVLLIFLALLMFYLAYRAMALPPAVTGVGFLAIAFVFLMGNPQRPRP